MHAKWQLQRKMRKISKGKSEKRNIRIFFREDGV